MLGVFLNSLANIGVSGADIGEMYVQQFLPALLAFAVFGLSCWYVGWFAKGRDISRTFVGAVGVLAATLVIALFVTTLTLNHDTKGSSSPSQPPDNSFLPY
jgi:ABC-type multidrug transport system permease subunit